MRKMDKKIVELLKKSLRYAYGENAQNDLLDLIITLSTLPDK